MYSCVYIHMCHRYIYVSVTKVHLMTKNPLIGFWKMAGTCDLCPDCQRAVAIQLLAGG